MYVLGNLIYALARVLEIVITIYIWLIVIRALVSWVNPDPYNPIVQFLKKTTDPALKPAQRIFPPLGGFDLSPIVVVLILVFLRFFLVPTLIRLSVDFGYTGFSGYGSFF